MQNVTVGRPKSSLFNRLPAIVQRRTLTDKTISETLSV